MVETVRLAKGGQESLGGDGFRGDLRRRLGQSRLEGLCEVLSGRISTRPAPTNSFDQRHTYYNAALAAGMALNRIHGDLSVGRQNSAMACWPWNSMGPMAKFAWIIIAKALSQSLSLRWLREGMVSWKPRL